MGAPKLKHISDDEKSKESVKDKEEIKRYNDLINKKIKEDKTMAKIAALIIAELIKGGKKK